MFLPLLVSLAFGHDSIAYQESTGDWATVPTCRNNPGAAYLNVVTIDGEDRYVCTDASMQRFYDVSYRDVRVDPHTTVRMRPRCPMLDSHRSLRATTSHEGIAQYVCESNRHAGFKHPDWYVSQDDPHRHHHFDDDGNCTCGQYNATFDMTPHHHSYHSDGFCYGCGSFSLNYVVRVEMHSHSYHNGICSCGHQRPKQHSHSRSCGHRTSTQHQRPHGH